MAAMTQKSDAPTSNANIDPNIPPGEVQEAEKLMKTRNYQQEMFEESLKRNIIVAMDTGSGKTHIAVLRIQAQLSKQDGKMCWFLTPGVALADQQCSILENYLPPGTLQFITGEQGPDTWTSQRVWDTVLSDVMVTTAQVLADALSHGFVKITQIGLLIFDEAHHCRFSHPYNVIMQNFYHHERQNGGEVPAILGLSASPIINNTADLRVFEANLDAIARTPTKHRDELIAHINRPNMRFAMYNPNSDFSYPVPSTARLPSNPKNPSLSKYEDPDFDIISFDDESDPDLFDFGDCLAPSFISNPVRTRHTPSVYDSLVSAKDSMNILDDPYIRELQSRKSPNLSAVIAGKKTDSQVQMKSLVTKAGHVLTECGPWAAEWFICEAVSMVLSRGGEIMEVEDELVEFEYEEAGIWKTEAEKQYLRATLEKVAIPEIRCNISAEGMVSAKVSKLIDVLMDEYSTEAAAEHTDFSGLIFADQRVAVAAVAQVLSSHPLTKSIFRVGTMVGSGESTRKKMKSIDDLISPKRNNSLQDFRDGKKNLLVATSVAEEGLDMPNCHMVICFDPPKSLKQFIQRRGRARRKGSEYVIMFSNEEGKKVADFEKAEEEMVEEYKNQERELRQLEAVEEGEEEEGTAKEMRIPETSAMFNLKNVVQKLYHFCQCLPSQEFVDNTPVFLLDKTFAPPGAPCWSCSVKLPNALDPKLRKFSSTQLWKSHKTARQDAAFEAFKALYEAKLLNDNLMPLHKNTQAEENKLPKRASKVEVPATKDMWGVVDARWEKGELWAVDIDVTFESNGQTVGVQLVLPIPIPKMEDLMLYWTEDEKAKVVFRECREIGKDPELLEKGGKATYRLFQNMFKQRMEKERRDFAYFFVPREGDVDWSQFEEENQVRALEVVERFNEDGELEDLGVVRDTMGTPYIFRRFRRDIDIMEAEDFKGTLGRDPSRVNLTQPLLEVKKLSQRRDFLHASSGRNRKPSKILLLLPEFLFLDSLPWRYTQLALFTPFLIDRVEKAILAADLKATLSFSGLPEHLLIHAITASSANEPHNYQRLEFLGDSVLKVLTSIALIDTFPQWHEGYLAGGKDGIVSNTTLSTSAKDLQLSQWIIRTPFTALKWSPRYRNTPRRGPATDPQLSTKVLADVVESLIGLSYLHSGHAGATSTIATFNLTSPSPHSQFPWLPYSTRISSLTSTAAENKANFAKSGAQYPSFFPHLEALIGYTFTNCALLLEAITHVSYGGDSINTSYQRLEYLGDSILDMIITEYLFHHPKKLSHVRMHLLRSAAVNAHFLAFLCLSTGIIIPPDPAAPRSLRNARKPRYLPLHRFLRHSHPELLRSQRYATERFDRLRDDIARELDQAAEYPWELLHLLDAPKHISDIIESIIGAIWVDSRGDYDAVGRFLEGLGLWERLDRWIEEGVEVDHPLSRFGMLAAREGKVGREGGKGGEVRYEEEVEKEGGLEGMKREVDDPKARWMCRVFLNGEILAEVRGCGNRAHARASGAREGLRELKKRMGERKEREEREAREKEEKEAKEKEEKEEIDTAKEVVVDEEGPSPIAAYKDRDTPSPIGGVSLVEKPTSNTPEDVELIIMDDIGYDEDSWRSSLFSTVLKGGGKNGKNGVKLEEEEEEEEGGDAGMEDVFYDAE